MTCKNSAFSENTIDNDRSEVLLSETLAQACRQADVRVRVVTLSDTRVVVWRAVPDICSDDGNHRNGLYSGDSSEWSLSSSSLALKHSTFSSFCRRTWTQTVFQICLWRPKFQPLFLPEKEKRTLLIHNLWSLKNVYSILPSLFFLFFCIISKEEATSRRWKYTVGFSLLLFKAVFPVFDFIYLCTYLLFKRQIFPFFEYKNIF